MRAQIYGPPVTEMEMSWVMGWLISLKVKVIVSRISPTLPDAVSVSELMIVPGGTSPILITLPIISWVDDVIWKLTKRIARARYFILQTVSISQTYFE